MVNFFVYNQISKSIDEMRIEINSRKEEVGLTLEYIEGAFKTWDSFRTVVINMCEDNEHGILSHIENREEKMSCLDYCCLFDRLNDIRDEMLKKAKERCLDYYLGINDAYVSLLSALKKITRKDTSYNKTWEEVMR